MWSAFNGFRQIVTTQLNDFTITSFHKVWKTGDGKQLYIMEDFYFKGSLFKNETKIKEPQKCDCSYIPGKVDWKMAVAMVTCTPSHHSGPTIYWNVKLNYRPTQYKVSKQNHEKANLCNSSNQHGIQHYSETCALQEESECSAGTHNF